MIYNKVQIYNNDRSIFTNGSNASTLFFNDFFDIENASVSVSVISVPLLFNEVSVSAGSVKKVDSTNNSVLINDLAVNGSANVQTSTSSLHTIINSVVSLGSSIVEVGKIDLSVVINDVVSNANGLVLATPNEITIIATDVVVSVETKRDASVFISTIYNDISANYNTVIGGAGVGVNISAIIFELNIATATGYATAKTVKNAIEIGLNNALSVGNAVTIATALQLNLSLGNVTAVEIDISKNEVLLLNSLLTNEMKLKSLFVNDILRKSLITNEIKTTYKIQ